MARTLALALALLSPAGLLAAPGAGENLGDRLLDDDLARLLSPPPAPATDAPSEPWQVDPDLMRRLIDQNLEQTEGSDVGQGDPLASAVSAMREAEGRLRAGAAEERATPAQREAVTHLERLIEALEKQCNGGGSCSSGACDKPKQASQRSQAKPGEGEQAGECDKPGSPSASLAMKANQSGTTSLGGAPGAEDPSALGPEPLRAAWGSLPERVREQMLRGGDVEFHPEYREEIERYFRRIAERPVTEAP